jgi:hypothetical protein
VGFGPLPICYIWEIRDRRAAKEPEGSSFWCLCSRLHSRLPHLQPRRRRPHHGGKRRQVDLIDAIASVLLWAKKSTRLLIATVRGAFDANRGSSSNGPYRSGRFSRQGIDYSARAPPCSRSPVRRCRSTLRNHERAASARRLGCRGCIGVLN